MNHKKFYLFVLLFLSLSNFGVCADRNVLSKTSDEPLEITSDRMDAFNDKKMVVFSGNAKVIQGNSVLKSDRILLYYKDQSNNEDKKIKISAETNGDLEKIEAKGNVSFNQEDRTATSDEAIYFRDSNKIVMTGNALLNEGKNSIRGDRVTIFLNDNKGLVESDNQKQVKAIIYPRQKNKMEKK